MSSKGAISRTAKKIIINIEEAAKYLSDGELEMLLSTVKKIENIEYFMKQKGNYRE
jgi:hypothetical protein